MKSVVSFLRPFAALLLAAAVVLPAAASAAEEVEYPKGEAPVLMVGDSMMRILGLGMEKEFRLAGVQPAVSFSSLGSGLVRPSVFDWYAKLDELLEANKPKTVFVAIGLNDRQALEREDGGIVKYGESEWESEYASCIARFMGKLADSGADLVVWFLLPPMKAAAIQEHAQLVNRIATEQAALQPKKDIFFLYDMGSVFSRKPGAYAQYTMSPEGAAIMVRDPDGVHLASGGAKAVAKACLKNFF